VSPNSRKTSKAEREVSEGLERAGRLAGARGDFLDELLAGSHPELEPGTLGGPPAQVSTPEQLSPSGQPSLSDTGLSVSGQPSVREQPSLPLTLTDEHRGATSVPHTVLDGLLPLLHPHEQLVYLRLYRLTAGFRRDTCKVGYPALARACSISRAAAIRAVEKLERRGLVERIGAVSRGANAERGNRYRVRLPEILSRSEQPSAGEQLRRPKRPMKGIEREHETAPAPAAPSIYEYRRIAARHWEASGHTLAPVDLAAKVRDTLVGQGVEPDPDLVAEAIRPMRA
jgi:DNA-binding Lrp family transcriptional regulator